MKHFMMTPLRRLEGVTYWVIDARFEDRDPKEDTWLKTLPKRKWSLEIAEIDHVRLNSMIMNYVDDVRGYNFSEELAERSDELRKSIQQYAQVIWPVIVRGEDFMLVDGYCRHAALKMMNTKRIYAYVGIL